MFSGPIVFNFISRLPVALLLFVVFSASLVGCDDASDNLVRPQVVGLITNNPNGLRNVEGFRVELMRLAIEQGREIEYRYSEQPTPPSGLDDALQSFVNEPVDLIFTAGTPTGVAAYRATRDSEVPVVFGVIADPVAAGVMSDLSEPGGNLTGVMLAQSQARRLSIFAELVPGARRVLVPFNPSDAAPSSAVEQITAYAEQLGLELLLAEVRSNDDVSRLIAEFPDVDAVFLVPDSTVNRRLGDLLESTEQRKIPVSGPSTAQVEAGALMTYGFIHREAGAQAARIAHRILRGADPAKTPVETAESYLQLNIAAAERIGLEVSDDLLQRADVIVRTDKRSKR